MSNNYLVHYTVELASGQFDLVGMGMGMGVWGGEIEEGLHKLGFAVNLCMSKQKRFFNNLNPSVAPYHH